MVYIGEVNIKYHERQRKNISELKYSTLISYSYLKKKIFKYFIILIKIINYNLIKILKFFKQ